MNPITTNVNKEEHLKEEEERRLKRKDGLVEVEKLDLSKIITIGSVETARRAKKDVIDVREPEPIEGVTAPESKTETEKDKTITSLKMQIGKLNKKIDKFKEKK